LCVQWLGIGKLMLKETLPLNFINLLYE
jgi:hypothetical protein